MAGLGSAIGAAINATQKLSKSGTLFEAYKNFNNDKSDEKENSTKGSSYNHKNVVGPEAENVGGIFGNTTRSNVRSNVRSTSTNAKVNATALEVLRNVSKQLEELNNSVNTISNDTSTLVQNSNLSLTKESLARINTKARINERELNLLQPTENVTTKKEGSTASPILDALESGIAGAAGAGLAGGAWKLLKSGLRAAAAPVAKVATRAVPVIAATLAIKSIAEYILDLPDGPTKDLILRLKDRKKISWNGKYITIDDVSYLRTLPKEQIALLIDSGKFEIQQLSALKSILEEPIVKTRVPQSQPTQKVKSIPVKEVTNQSVSEPQKVTETKQVNVNAKESSVIKNDNESFTALDLQTRIVEPPPENVFNTEERNPKFELPKKENEKNLNFGVVAIKQLNIEELMLPEGQSIFGENSDFIDEWVDKFEKVSKEVGSGIQSFAQNVGDKIKNVFEPGDQRPPGYHDEKPFEKATGKFGNDADAKTAQKMLMEKGWTREQAAGIVGNLQAESGLNTKAVGDSGKAKGIGQWHPDRQEKFKKISDKNLEEATFEEQINFVDWELKNTEKKAGEKLKTAKTPEEAAKLFEKHYERDAISSRGDYGKERVAYANEAAKMDLSEIEKDKSKDIQKQESPKVESKETVSNDPNKDKHEVPVASLDKSFEELKVSRDNLIEANKKLELKGMKPSDSSKKLLTEIDEKFKTRTASLEKPKESTGDIKAEAIKTSSEIQPKPSEIKDLKETIVSQGNKQPTIIQSPPQPTQQVKQPKNNPNIMNVRNDDPLLLSLQYWNLRT